ncbi:Hypothetical protein CAP_1490 [Chondromyces apiculatus DSM 436]|uniref:Uncharacterized protein n=1 Tax=Chondromyces apiculatus DSM 436 TaxID=1192034 RepID=A0A017TBX6_9BACT|nr:Hypothetical protein CAP_1490 [Chondromyces apiculatus DSM 436]
MTTTTTGDEPAAQRLKGNSFTQWKPRFTSSIDAVSVGRTSIAGRHAV